MYLELLFQTAVVIYFYILSIKRIRRVKIFSTKRDRIQNINDKRTLQLSIFFSNRIQNLVPVNMTYRYMYAVYMQHVPSCTQ